MNDLNDKCPWPHFVDSPIRVYDRDSYDKYQTGEYKVPERCICGATMVYDSPISICLVEHGKMVGEMLLELDYPLTFIKTDILEEQRVADAYNKHSGPKKGVAGKIEAQRWSEKLGEAAGEHIQGRIEHGMADPEINAIREGVVKAIREGTKGTIEERRTVESIKVTVTTKTSDGSVSNLVFPLEPYTFQMSQSRQVEPVYETFESLSLGKPEGFRVKLPGTRLSLSGYVVKETSSEEKR